MKSHDFSAGFSVQFMGGLHLHTTIAVLACLAVLPWLAAAADFDDFESYAVGSNLHGQGGWAGWAGDANAGALVSSNFSFSPTRSVSVTGSNNVVRTFSDATNGQWIFSVMQYIPSTSSGTSYVTLLNTYQPPYTAADLNASVQIQNDLANGQVISELGGGASLPLVADQWTQLRFEINLTANSVSEFYNGQFLSTHVWQDGTGLNRIQALELFANDAGPVHFDNVTLLPVPTTVPVIPGLVLHLPFNNNLTDATGRSNNGVAINQTHNTSNTISPTFVSGQLGNALHYESDFGPPATPGATTTTNTTYVTLGVRPDLQFGSNVNFTVAFWIKLPFDFIGGDLPFFANAAGSLGNPGFVFSPAYGYGNGSGENPDPAPLNYGGWGVSLYDTVGTNGARIYGDPGSINDGGWHHLIFVFDRSSQVLTYLDGSPARSFNISGTTTAAAKNIDTGLAATIGQDPTGILAETGSGDIDDLGVWKRALTPLEAATLYLAGINNLSFVGSQSYTVNIQAGYNLIANQLDRGSNTLGEIMPIVPEGAHFFKFDNAVGIYLTASYYNGAWQPGNLVLNPGEGAFLYSPSGFPLTLTGSPHVPVLPLSNNCSGSRLLSRQTNGIGNFDNITGVPPVSGELVYKWNGAGYSVYEFIDAVDGWEPSEPIAAVGEALWIRQFTGPGCPGGSNPRTPPPVITTQPLGQTVGLGANVTFTVAATGNPPLIHQWRLNGVNIPGETNTSLTVNNVQATQSGDYSVVVANPGGATVSQIAALIVVTGDLGFADNFADRVLFTTAAGVGSGSNINASKEVAEPAHAGNSGGKSVWLAWQAPASGIATFSTAGSGFDTLLAVYRGTNLAALKRTATDDDSAGFYSSEVQFNAVGGVTYNIALDGSYGASDHIVLNWNLEITTATIPEIATQPKDQIVVSGGTFTLSVGAGAGSLPVDYQWFLNDQPIPSATGASLTISNALPSDLGLYRVRISTRPPAVRQIFSAPTFVQMSIVQLGAFASVIARDKFLDVTSLGLDLDFLQNQHVGGLPNAAPVGGFTGTQIFNTYGAAKEPGEPNHCGETGGASYWFAYQSPANGRLSVNTSNSTYNTVLAIYTGPNPVTSFSQLSCAACANVAGLGNEVVEFNTAGGTIYYVAVDGVGGASGTVRLSYDMITARPVIANQAQNTGVAAGNNGTVSVAIANTSVSPLAYQWQFNAVNIAGATQSSYTRPAFQPLHQGNYRVIITNLAGAVTSSIAMMYLSTSPMRPTNSFINGGGYFQTRWLGPTGGLLTVQVSTNFTNWSSVSTSSATTGFINYTDTTPAGLNRRFYRTLLAFP